MKIALFFTYGYSLKTWSDSGTLQKELSYYVELNKEFGYKFKLFTYGDSSDLEIEINKAIFEVVPIYQRSKRINNKFISYLYSISIPFTIKNELDDVSLIKQNQLQGSWVTLILKFLTKKPLFTRTGYDVFKFSIHRKDALLKRFFYYFLTQVTLIVSNVYSVTSKTERNFLKKYFLITKNIELLPNFIEKNSYPDILSRELNKVLCVGRLEEQKNYPQIIKSFVNSNFTLDIVGTGSERKALEKLAEELNVNVNFLGQLENKKLESLYEKYSFFISLSEFEGNPKSVLEAMSKGCIVFLSDIKNHVELIENKENGFIVCSNFDVIEKINSLSNNKKEIRKISSNASGSVFKNNLLNNLVSKENLLIENLMAN